jgi:hypothetical protein
VHAAEDAGEKLRVKLVVVHGPGSSGTRNSVVGFWFIEQCPSDGAYGALNMGLVLMSLNIVPNINVVVVVDYSGLVENEISDVVVMEVGLLVANLAGCKKLLAGKITDEGAGAPSLHWCS